VAIRNCPTREELSSYIQGGLPEDLTEAVAEHVETCVICDATLDTLERQGDPLFRGLRSPVPPPSELDSPEFQRAMQAAEAAGLGGGASATPPDAKPSLSELGRLGEYELLAKLDKGGMGTVYRARQTRLGKIVALKVLSKEHTSDPRAVARFEIEMKAIGQLSHPNIVQALDARDIEDTTVLVMEYVDGLDLCKLLQRAGPLPIADACELIRQTAVGLQYIHENRLVHRDIKPSNLMLTPPGQVKILDLGLALLDAKRTPSGELTSNGLAMGTPDYIAPEQADDSHRVDIRADIYSLGCTLYHLLTGRTPFSGPDYKTPLDKVVGHTRDTAPTVKTLRASVPDELSKIVERMMAKEPSARFATPAEVAAALTPFATGCDLAGLLATPVLTRGTPADTAPIRRPLASSPPWWRRRSSRIAAAAVPIFILLAIFICIKIEVNKTSASASIEFSNKPANESGARDKSALQPAISGAVVPPPKPGWTYPRADSEGSGFYRFGSKVPTQGPFIPLWSVTTPVTDVLTGDITGDGSLKIVVASNKVVKIYNGQGTLVRTIALPMDAGYARLGLLADCDGDGVADIGVGTENTSDLRSWFYKGDGTLLRTFAMRAGDSSSQRRMIPADITSALVIVRCGAGFPLTPRGWAGYQKETGKLAWQYKTGTPLVQSSTTKIGGKLRMTGDSASVNNGASGDGWEHNGTPTTDRSIYTVAVNQDGNEVFTHDYRSGGRAANYFVDLDGSGVKKVLVFESHNATSYHGTSKIHLLDADNGAMLKTFNGPRDIPWHDAGVWGRIGHGFILATNREGARVLDADLGLLAFSTRMRGKAYAAAELHGDGGLQFLFGDGRTLRVTDSTFGELWTWTAPDTITGVQISDVNGDGANEVIVDTQNGLTVLGAASISK
jgi:serine/threonine protein kinase